MKHMLDQREQGSKGARRQQIATAVATPALYQMTLSQSTGEHGPSEECPINLDR